MATVCEYCGHKTNEVKSGGGIESKGKRIILNVTDPSDMSRDVLKVMMKGLMCMDKSSNVSLGSHLMYRKANFLLPYFNLY